MTSLQKLRVAARYNILTPVALLALTAVAHAQVVIDEGDTVSTQVVIPEGGSLTNNGTITYPGDAVYSDSISPIQFILNSETGEIIGIYGVAIENDVLTFENAGSIMGLQRAFTTDGGVGVFVNSGNLSSDSSSRTVDIGGDVGSFTNTGTIKNINVEGRAIRFDGRVDKFVNDGLITSAGLSNAVVAFNAGAGDVVNNGIITSTGSSNGVAFDMNVGPVTSFTNTNIITGGETRVGVGFFADGGQIYDLGRFNNSGTITGNANAAVVFGSYVSSFTNSGTLNGANWDGVFFAKGVENFLNEASGNIFNSDVGLTDGGNGIGFNIDSVDGGTVGSFVNDGTIRGDLAALQSSGVGFFTNGNEALQVGRFVNTGTIAGSGTGVNNNGGFDSFDNSGTITGGIYNGVNASGPVGTFNNSGRILSVDGSAAQFNGDVGTFTNSGIISSTNTNGVTFEEGLLTGSNSGTIESLDPVSDFGLRIDATGSTFTNSGTIRGATAVYYDTSTGAGSTFINSGTIEATAYQSIEFNNTDDLLVLKTGSRILGEVQFAGGNDTLDFSDFSGNQLLTVYGLNNIVAGDQLYFEDLPNDQIAIVEKTGLTAPVGMATSNIVGQVQSGIANALSGVSGGSDDVAALGYAAGPAPTEAQMAISDAQAPSDRAIWGSLIGGGSADNSPVDMGSIFGGIIAGSHVQVAPGTTIGALAGAAVSRTSINNDGQVVTSSTGLLGLYGRTDVGMVELSYSLLGGIAGHDSVRQVVGSDDALADFTSWFLAPSVGLELPVLQTESGELSVAGSVSYIGGGISGYTEDGSIMDLTVGSQDISLLDARIGLAGEHDVNATTTLTGKAGLLVQSNFGGTTVPVTYAGQTINASAPGETDLGLYAGIGLKSALTSTLSLTGNVDGEIRFDGLRSITASAGLKGSF